MPSGISLAEILEKEGLVAPGGLNELRGGRGRRPVEIAVRDLEVDEVALVAAIRRHVRVPLADPAKLSVDSDAVRTLARDACRRLKVLPLSLDGWGESSLRLDLAMADPTDDRAIAEVEEAAGYRVAPALMTLSAIEELVETAYGALVTEVMRRDPRAKTVPAEVAASEEKPPAQASLELRHRALVDLLLDKQLIRAEELEAALARLLERERS
jgi:hypothetical protein